MDLSQYKLRFATGSIGVNESRFECEYTVESLEQLQKMWEDMSTMEAHQQFVKDLEPIIVSGSNRWEILEWLIFNYYFSTTMGKTVYLWENGHIFTVKSHPA